MKKVTLAFLSAALLSFSFSTYATNVSCPPGNELRELVTFGTTYKESSNYWNLVSNAFKHGEHEWNVIYRSNFYPFVIDDPSQAVALGSDFFSKSALLRNPQPITNDAGIECNYTPENAQSYSVVAITPARFGLV